MTILQAQLVGLHDTYSDFEALDIEAIAIAQEDKDLESHGKFYQHFDPAPRFKIGADIGRVRSDRYGRTRTYLIDKQGVVRQVFPQLLHHRASWRAIWNESKRVLSEDAAATSRPTER